MKLLVCQAKVIVSCELHQNQLKDYYSQESCQYDFKIIQLIPGEIGVKFKFRFKFDREYYLMCTKFNSKLYFLQIICKKINRIKRKNI
ncbi:unnamed protein product [Paramecium sonneborni]|uniref:Uncharacterized protein n=1 Tax=Paramecium sonneborni TaxID=65129 RepID=A0A8S1RCJ4_9CILI|nr:unnamed protein product [Paramecium sonneborni]